MNIEFSYEIVRVDEKAKCMEIVYSAPGYETFFISARLPFLDETLENVIRSFAPIQRWVESSMEVTVPEIGIKGTLAVVEEQAESEEEKYLFTPTSGEIPSVIF